MSADSAFRPSAYSAALLKHLLLRKAFVHGADVLDIGCGSGVLLHAAAGLGARGVFGVDIEPAAVAETRRVLDTLGPGVAVDVRQGSLYAPVGERRFDVILANLPHFPMEHLALDERLASWSSGGGDGRHLLDPVIDGIGVHLQPDGFALIAHNAFVGLEKTRETADAHELAVEVIDTVMVPLPPEKLACMTPQVLNRETGQTIHRVGAYVFAEVAVLMLRRVGAREHRA
ncbi:MAG: 50S ribosomal protein L11 methyltransferase [Pseudomonadota bacterium]